MSITLLVEPEPSGHRFQAVAHVAQLARRRGQLPVLLTSRGATSRDEFAVYLAELALEVHETYSGVHPPTHELVEAIVRYCRTTDVQTVVVLDADQSLKRWWCTAARAFRSLPHRPRVVFMLTRYPARLRFSDRFGWLLRISKASLALLAMATGSLDRIVGFAGREDLAPGWLVKRARDPAICGFHSRDRAALRAELGLPAQRRLVGVFGVLTLRKNRPLVLDALLTMSRPADLVLAGAVQSDVAAWLAALDPQIRARVIVRDGFLPNDVLDRYVAAVDAVVIALTNNGPSGIMGKALAAGVPVVSAGSVVRARELAATGGGVLAELRAPSIGAALDAVLAARPAHRVHAIPPATAEEFAAAVLGPARG